MSGNRSKSAFFEGGWVTLSADFRGKGASPTNHSWYQSSRVIALSCGIKISAVHHLVLSQSTRVTDGRTGRQNYDFQDRPRICSRGKNSLKYENVNSGSSQSTHNSLNLDNTTLLLLSLTKSRLSLLNLKLDHERKNFHKMYISQQLYTLKCSGRVTFTSSSAMTEIARARSTISGGQFEAKLQIKGLVFTPLRHDAIYAYASHGNQTISSIRPSC